MKYLYFWKLVLEKAEKNKKEKVIKIMSKKSRIEKNSIFEIADWGACFLFIIVIVIGILAYNYECLGKKWTKVLEIVGGPFSLGFGFFAFERGFKMLDEYKKRIEKKSDK